METTRTRIGPADHGRPMSFQEFQDAEETPGYLYELARGVLDVTEVPSDDHGQILDNLHLQLDVYRLRHPGPIRRIAHGSDIRLLIPEVGSDRHPDLAVIFPDAPRNHLGRQIPALVVEVLSPGARARRRDHVEKRDEYLALGLREYWIVDPFQKLVLVLARREPDAGAGAFWHERTFTSADRIASELLPGFDAPVADLWPDGPTA